MKSCNIIKNYLEYCEFDKELDKNTLKAYRIDLRQYYEFTGEEITSKETIEKYIRLLHKKYKSRTTKRKIASMKAFYTYLEEKQIISENPFRRIRTKFKEEKVLPRIIPKNDIERLLNYMYGQLRKQKGKNILRDLAVVEMFFATGARVYEISNIRIENIDMKTGSIYFNGKGRKERVIQIGEQSVIKLLQKYYEQNKAQIKKSGYFFVNQKGDRFSEQSIRRMLKKYTKQAGISRNITPHMFRHSFATYLIEEGVDISCVQQILGHSSIKTTQIYIHVAAGIQAEILQKKHPRNKMHIWAA